jgi:ATP-dependent helicase/nuclease subunit B
MEGGEEKKYLPLKVAKDGVLTGESLVSAEQVGRLSKHVGDMLRRAVGEILEGRIECSPYYKSAADNACLYCEYRPVCGIDEESGEKRRFLRKVKTDEIWETLGRV